MAEAFSTHTPERFQTVKRPAPGGNLPRPDEFGAHACPSVFDGRQLTAAGPASSLHCLKSHPVWCCRGLVA